MIYIFIYIAIPIIILFLSGIRIVRPTQRGLIERLGKYQNFASPGFHWFIPSGSDLVIIIGEIAGVLPLKGNCYDDKN
jgi:regulator of protease activity HflC (stomatin/prohibitin superfamily)